MKSKRVLGILISVLVAGGLSITGATAAQAAIYKCGPSCYTDDPNWKPGQSRNWY